MKLRHGHHLGYCTNIHRGESWEEIFAALQRHALAVRDRVSAGEPFGLGLRLGAAAVQDLAEPDTRFAFQRWLERENCYVFTINGFPYGQFHGTRVKEQVYRPDWTTPERLDYTLALFDLMAELVPPGGEGSISTLPLSFKAFDLTPAAFDLARTNLTACARHIERLIATSGRNLHLGLEPEPLCTLETSDELVAFLADFDEGARRVIGMNYDCCHLAIEFEDAAESIRKIHGAGVKISKFHLSSALRLQPTAAARERLRDFDEPTYLHQVIASSHDGTPPRRYTDLPEALAAAAAGTEKCAPADEWRVHFHVPVHAQPELVFQDTRDHIEAVFDALAVRPDLCPHLEIETYTWAVLPGDLRQADVVDQIAREYDWVLQQLARRGLGR